MYLLFILLLLLLYYLTYIVCDFFFVFKHICMYVFLLYIFCIIFFFDVFVTFLQFLRFFCCVFLLEMFSCWFCRFSRNKDPSYCAVHFLHCMNDSKRSAAGHSENHFGASMAKAMAFGMSVDYPIIIPSTSICPPALQDICVLHISLYVRRCIHPYTILKLLCFHALCSGFSRFLFVCECQCCCLV